MSTTLDLSTYRHPARRRTELGLIVMAVILIGGLYALAGEGKAGSLPANIGPFLGLIFVLMLVGHVAVRRWAPEADPILLPVAGLLNGIGYVFIARLSSSQAAAQATWSLFGMACFVVVLIVVKRARDLERYRYTFAVLGLILLLLPMIPHFGEDINGAKLWVHVGSHEFQPGELAKLALAIFFASALIERADQLSKGTRRIGKMLVIDPRHLAPLLVMWGLSMMIFLAENDLGSSFLFFAMFLGMLWVATNRSFYLLAGGGLFGAGAVLATRVMGHAQSRIQGWLNPWPNASTTGYQIIQGWFAIANGGLWGTGPGQSNAANIPEASSDLIFAVIAEEIGLIGAAALLIGYMLLVGTGLRVAVRCENPFEKLLATGLSLILGIQTFVIVGGVMRVIPLTGITLPFVAYGGSALISNYILLALLVRISDTAATQASTPIGGANMNRQIRFVGLGVMVLFVILFVQLNYLQVVHSSKLQSNPLNGEEIVKEYNLPRGEILAANGTVLAHSQLAPAGSSFKYERLYPTGSLFGDVTGYYSFIYGEDGVEKSYDGVLSDAKHSVGVPTNLSDLSQLLLDADQAQNVTLTLSVKLQQAAETGLAGRLGSVVALDPQTGAILAMYSNPSYNPESISQLSTTQEEAAWKQLLATPNDPLTTGAYRNRWPPGSTFKVITSSAIFDHDPSVATQDFPDLSALTLPDTSTLLHNFGGEVCGGELTELFTVSCDTGFAKIGLELGASNLAAEANAFGFNQTPPIDLPYAAQSVFPPVSSFTRNLPTLAYSAIGQEDVSATPLEMAMVAGAIADKGVMMTPHVMSRVTDSQGKVVSTYKSTAWRQATSAATAQKLTTLMESVVNSPDGTGVEAAIPGVEIAAKTGTAQTGTGKTDDWFIAFDASDPDIAVAVLLPDQSAADEFQGGTIAAPIAKAVIEAFLAGAPASSRTTTTTTTTLPSSLTTTPATTAPPVTPATVAPPTTPTTLATVPPTAPPTTAPKTPPTTTTKKGT